MQKSSWLVNTVRLLVVAVTSLLCSQARAETRPAILLHSPSGTDEGQVDLGYLADLHAAGLEVDFSNHHREFRWERLKRFNAIVIYGAPAEDGTKDSHVFPRSEPYQKAFAALLERYLDAGGGVLVMAATFKQPGARYLADVIEPWEVRLPLEWLHESGPTFQMRRIPGVNLVYTDQITPCPVSQGVQGIWYPLDDDGGMTDPIWVADDWTVVVRGSKTSYTVPLPADIVSEGRLPRKIFTREGGVREPPLFAIREYKKGRLALMAQWPQFSFAQGAQWLYDRQVLSRGVSGKKSDFGRLLENTLRWLAEPSLRTASLGGHHTDPARFEPPNSHANVAKEYSETSCGENSALEDTPPTGNLYRGLIGARTSLSDGEGRVEDFARAAKEVGLDFVIFLEDFTALTPEKLAQLKAQCREHSDTAVKMYPGYAIDNNIGNHLFLHGFGIEWPPESILTGPQKTQLNQQYQNEKGEYEVRTPVLNWLLRFQQERGARTQIGFYNFAGSGKGMRLPDLRMYSQAGVRFYEDGEFVEDVTDEYLLTAQGTNPPGPVSVNLVRSPQALKQEVEAGHALTYAQALSLDVVYRDALRYTGTYDGPLLFFSDGPIIEAWPACYRVINYGAEDFVTGRSWMRSPLKVRSDAGLKEISIFDGTRLFRRFLPRGAKQFSEVLELEGTLHRNLVLVAEDVEGRKAVSYARRSWKEGGGGINVIFCGDHINDCKGYGYLGKGPGQFQWTHPAGIRGGSTWDGGPQGDRPLLLTQGSATLQPVLRTKEGTEGLRPFNNTPLLEFADERVMKVRSVRRDVFPEPVPVHNPWHTHGPLVPSRLFTYTLEYTEFQRPSLQVTPTGWPAQAVRKGAAVSIFAGVITFRRELVAESLRLLWLPSDPRGHPPVILIVGSDEGTKMVDVSSLKEKFSVRLDAGDWAGFYSPDVANNVLLVNRNQPLELRMERPGSHNWFSLWAVGFDGRRVKARESYRYELLSVHDAVDVRNRSGWRFLQVLSYLDLPDGFELLRGRRLDSPGLMELQAENGAVELQITKPPVPVELSLPIRVQGLNPRWSAGFFQKEGANTTAHYGGGKNRYTALGFDMDGSAYCSLYPDDAERTRVVLGHPIVADASGGDLFLQVTHLCEDPHRWHVSVNNPTDRKIRTTLRQVMDLPGLSLPATEITLPAGGYTVVELR